MSDLPFILREAKRDDEAYVLHSWIESAAVECFGWAQPHYVFIRWHDIVERLIRTERTLVAVFNEDPDYIIGWACATRRDPSSLLYVYVRPTVRRNGLAAFLCHTLGLREPLEVAFLSRKGVEIAKRHQFNHVPLENQYHAKSQKRRSQTEASAPLSPEPLLVSGGSGGVSPGAGAGL